MAVPVALAFALITASIPAAVAASRPSAPRSVTAKPGNTVVRVGWAAPSSNGGAGINQYGVQRAAHATGPWTTVAKPSAASRTWTNTGLHNGTRYYYRVRAHNSVGWSAASSVVSAVPRTVPSAPRSPAVAWGDAFVTLSWQNPASTGGAAIDKFQVQYSPDGTTWSGITTSAPASQLTVTGLQNGTAFHFRVRAHNVAGWGSTSSEVLATPGLPAPPTNVVGHPNPEGLLIDWTASATISPSVTAYDVAVSTDQVHWTFHLVSNPPNTFLNLFGGIGTTYYFQVRAVNSAGFSAFSDIGSAVAGTTPSAVRNLAVKYYGSPFFWNSVTWDGPAGGSSADGYYVERIITEGPYQLVATNDSAHLSYLDQGITYSTDYWYRVTPYNAVGSGPSTVIQITTPAHP